MKTKNLYKLPLEKKDIIRIDNSSPAHIGKLKYAIDFLCNVGTKIYAAEDGEVVEIVDNKKEGGSDKSLNDAGNFILIKHANNEFSHYAHLKYKGILVKKGDYVKAGDLIAYSNNTGFSYGPHLHFSVIHFTGKTSNDFESLKIKWEKNNPYNKEINLVIRKATLKDAKEISKLIKKNLLEVNIKDYPKSLILDLCNQYKPSYIRKLSENSKIIVVSINNKIIGTGRFQSGFIYDIFVNPKYHKKGIGKKIMNCLEILAKKKGYKKVRLPASKTALDFYKKIGYKISKNYKIKSKTSIFMEKRLT